MRFPGDVICNEEEALPGAGVFVEDGKILASVLGEVVRKQGRVSLHMKKRIVFAKHGYIVYGMVKAVLEDRAIVDILLSRRRKERTYITPQDAIIHISQIKPSFVEDIHNELSVGDIVKAKIASLYPALSLSIKEKEFGVVLAYCSNCRTLMERIGPSLLLCPYCRRRETRKLTKDYRNIKNMINLWFI
jgi:exosome complex component CSL4